MPRGATWRSRDSALRSDGFGRRERHVPGIVAVEPSGVVVAALHPGIGAGDGLDTRCPRFAMGFVKLKRGLNVVHIFQAARQNRGVFDCGCRALSPAD